MITSPLTFTASFLPALKVSYLISSSESFGFTVLLNFLRKLHVFHSVIKRIAKAVATPFLYSNLKAKAIRFVLYNLFNFCNSSRC